MPWPKVLADSNILVVFLGDQIFASSALTDCGSPRDTGERVAIIRVINTHNRVFNVKSTGTLLESTSWPLRPWRFVVSIDG